MFPTLLLCIKRDCVSGLLYKCDGTGREFLTTCTSNTRRPSTPFKKLSEMETTGEIACSWKEIYEYGWNTSLWGQEPKSYAELQRMDLIQVQEWFIRTRRHITIPIIEFHRNQFEAIRKLHQIIKASNQNMVDFRSMQSSREEAVLCWSHKRKDENKKIRTESIDVLTIEPGTTLYHGTGTSFPDKNVPSTRVGIPSFYGSFATAVQYAFGNKYKGADGKVVAVQVLRKLQMWLPTPSNIALLLEQLDESLTTNQKRAKAVRFCFGIKKEDDGGIWVTRHSFSSYDYEMAEAIRRIYQPQGFHGVAFRSIAQFHDEVMLFHNSVDEKGYSACLKREDYEFRFSPITPFRTSVFQIQTSNRKELCRIPVHLIGQASVTGIHFGRTWEETELERQGNRPSEIEHARAPKGDCFYHFLDSIYEQNIVRATPETAIVISFKNKSETAKTANPRLQGRHNRSRQQKREPWPCAVM